MFIFMFGENMLSSIYITKVFTKPDLATTLPHSI